MKKIILSIMFVFLSTLISNAQDFYNQLTAYYQFSNNLSDLSANQFNCMASGGSFTYDQFSNPNSAYSLNNGEFIYVPSSNTEFDLNTSATFCALVKLDQLPNNNPEILSTIASKDVAIGEKSKWVFGFSQNRLCLHINKLGLGSGQYYYSDTFNLQLSSYYHVAFMIDASAGQVLFFLNGLNIGTASLTQPLWKVNAPFRIGFSETNNQINGSIDEVYFFKRKIGEVSLNKIILHAIPPLKVEFTRILGKRLSVIWTPVTGATSYTFEYKEKDSLTWLKRSSSNADTLNINDLKENTLYDYRLRTRCNNEKSAWTKSAQVNTRYDSFPGSFLPHQIIQDSTDSNSVLVQFNWIQNHPLVTADGRELFYQIEIYTDEISPTGCPAPKVVAKKYKKPDNKFIQILKKLYYNEKYYYRHCVSTQMGVRGRYAGVGEDSIIYERFSDWSVIDTVSFDSLNSYIRQIGGIDNRVSNVQISNNSSTKSLITSNNSVENLDVLLYPNPVTQLLNIDLSEFDGLDATVQIINGNGAILRTFKKIGASENVIQLDVTSFNSGIYYAKITYAEGVIGKKFIVNK